MACSYKTITLVPGEQFILPPGAEIIGVSDTTALEVTNGCTALDKLESLECYTVAFVAADSHDSTTHVGEPSVNKIRGLYVNNTWYDWGEIIANSCGAFPMDQIANRINQDPVLSNFIFPKNTFIDQDCDNGGIGTMCFKTYPSLAKDMYFLRIWYLLGVGAPEPYEMARVYPVKSSDYTSVGACGC